MNLLNRDQQNKTERWVEKLKEYDNGFGYLEIETDYVIDLISQLLSNARREERERCLEALPNGELEPHECGSEFGCSLCLINEGGGRMKDLSKEAIQSLTTAEESIKELK